MTRLLSASVLFGVVFCVVLGEERRVIVFHLGISTSQSILMNSLADNLASQRDYLVFMLKNKITDEIGLPELTKTKMMQFVHYNMSVRSRELIN